MFTEESLRAVIKAQQSFVFEKFDLEDARRMGEMLYAQGQKEEKPLAVRVLLDDLIVYQSFMPGTNQRNCWWMDKKCRTVNRTHECSLKARIEKELHGPKPWMLDEDTYAICGGGFPIFVQGEYRGVICVSGLPHLEDHRSLTGVIADFLGKEHILVPVLPD